VGSISDVSEVIAIPIFKENNYLVALTNTETSGSLPLGASSDSRYEEEQKETDESLILSGDKEVGKAHIFHTDFLDIPRFRPTKDIGPS
jgi:hypothetical protein